MSYTPQTSGVTGAQSPRLLDQVRERIRFRHYSIRTEQAYTRNRGQSQFPPDQCSGEGSSIVQG